MRESWKLEALCARFHALPWILEPEDLPPAAEAAMRAVCNACQVREDCEAYIVRAGIVGGFWAGRDRATAADVSASGGAA